jgi:hypothetical protein
MKISLYIPKSPAMGIYYYAQGVLRVSPPYPNDTEIDGWHLSGESLQFKEHSAKITPIAYLPGIVDKILIPAGHNVSGRVTVTNDSDDSSEYVLVENNRITIFTERSC